MNKIEVIIPMPHEPNHGVHAGSHESASRVVIRTNLETRTTIQRAAALLNITEAEFMRASSYNMAKALEQRMKERDNDKHDSIRS